MDAALRTSLTKKRWTVLIVSCIVNVVIGTGYAWSVFGAAWATKFSEMGDTVTPAQTALAFTICNAVGPITMISGGKINDALGPKWVIFAGGIMFGGGIFVAGFANDVMWLIIWYGIVFGLGMGFVYSCTIGNTVKFFPDKKGMVGGLTTMAYGLGSVILAPIAAEMVKPESFGVATTFMILGVIYLVIICGGAFLITQCPPGFMPDGYTPPAPAANAKAVTDKNWNQMLADPIFWVMFILLLTGAFFGLMMISQCASVAGFMGITYAAVIVTVLSLFNALGRVGCGVISDKLGRINTLIMCLCIAIVGLVMMFVAGGSTGDPVMDGDAIKAIPTTQPILFVVGVCFVGFAFGAFMGVYPGFTADQFGLKNNGVNYGIMFIAFAAAGVLGPIIMGMTKASTGTYQLAFIICIILAVVGLALSFVYKAMSKVKDA
jgi:MFS family permease